MRRVYIIVFTLVLIFLFAFTYPTETAVSPNIRIDGQLRQFTPGAHIFNNRTMIPVRFVVEDEALQGQVYWDNQLQKVAIDCKGKYVELFIGNNQARVDGEFIYLDAAPYIFQDRTYIPLRFMAESLGAVVGWDQSLSEVLISFNQKPRVCAYYYRSFNEFQENAPLFTDVLFRWLECNSRGELSYEYKDRYDEAINLAHSKGLNTHASVVLMGKDPLHELLSSKENRSRLIGNLLDQVKNNNYNGVNIDFELMAAADAGNFTTFLRELKNALGVDKDLSVAVFARTGKEKWASPYEYKKIGEIADWVVVMAYDYSYTNSAAGPIAPLWWVKEVTAYMIQNIPREKIMLGLPTYGYDWASGLKTTSITAPKLQALKEKYQVTEGFDYQSMSPYYNYVDSNNKYHQIWLENEFSLSGKWDVAISNQLGGISFWRIGNGFDDLYKLLQKNQTMQ
ncbi:MAG: glycosyl hydrolase family 18 protein [Syntrophomonadaceae bacterium]|nr:glycosyl hydrolase family 18 protein [Syntrophomonadaceae bacterium]MDD3022617.1 glycosyl hydrolase family 18 protein [Syntrophomonadaceae bacterium]